MTFARTAACCLACLTLVTTPTTGTGTEPNDPFHGAVEVFRFTFETDQDLDYDRLPDDWIRRIGREFPHYVKTEIDLNQGRDSRQSLAFQANGGQAILYSPVWRVDALHAYVFHGFVRTQQLKHNAAVISLSFLNHKRQRIQRFLTQPVSGTHTGWTRVRIGPISPRPDVRFVVVGCHLVNGSSADLAGSAWFDELWLGRLPQLELVSNFQTQFVEPGSPVRIESRLSGLDALPPVLFPAFPPFSGLLPTAVPVQPRYRLDLQLLDRRDQVRDQQRVEFPSDSAAREHRPGEKPPQPRAITWELAPQEHGFYRVQASLFRDDQLIVQKQATFAVLDLVDQRLDGEFGWSFPRGTEGLPHHDLADAALQAGVNWLKFPVWNSVGTGQGKRSAEISEFFELLSLRRIKPVGLLNDPPPELRRKFAAQWAGVGEIFTQSPKVWTPSLDPVIAKYSSTVQHWQLGDDRDGSFVGRERLPETLTAIQREFDRIGRETRIGVHWEAALPLPTDPRLARAFFSLDQGQFGSEAFEPRSLSPEQGTTSAAARWILLKPLPKSTHSPEERGADLVKRMVAAKMTQPDAIFVQDVLDEEQGLLHSDGSPTLLFLPWRTTALNLQGATYLGSLNLPQGSQNVLFEREGGHEVVMFVWNNLPVTETVYLGEPNQVTAINLWGEQTRLPTDPDTGQQVFQAGPMPLVIRGCSGPIARWRLALRFETGRLASATGVHRESLLGRNTFPQGVSGTVTIHAPPGWDVEPRVFPLQAARNEEFRLPMQLTLPPNATLGIEPMAIDVEIDADRKYRLRVIRPLQIGLGDVELTVTDRRLDNGTLEIEQTLINKTAPEEILNFDCNLFIPGAKRQKTLVTKLGTGRGVKLYYVPEADALKGQEIWVRAEQSNGRRVLNFRWTVGKGWGQSQAKPVSP